MTNNQMNRFRRTLENKVVELNRSTRRREGLVIEKTADSFDRMIRASERELVVHTLEAECTRLREVGAALQRIDEGTYGTCIECEEPVGPARLSALPWAALCIRCQEEQDCRCGATRARFALPLAA